jgi:hypothetical protein
VQAEADKSIRAALDEAGLSDRIDARKWHQYVEACVRGLAIDQIFSGERGKAPPALDHLREHVVRLLDGH